MTVEELVAELRQLCSRFASYESITGDPSYDTGVESGYRGAAFKLEDLLGKVGVEL